MSEHRCKYDGGGIGFMAWMFLLMTWLNSNHVNYYTAEQGKQLNRIEARLSTIAEVATDPNSAEDKQ